MAWVGAIVSAAATGYSAYQGSKDKGDEEISAAGFTQPRPQHVGTPYGSAGLEGDTWAFTPSNETIRARAETEALRKSILQSLGVGEGGVPGKSFEEIYMDEYTRLTMPKLEQTLFSRGLGGSQFYGGQVTDQLAKLATQAKLTGEQAKSLRVGQLGTVETIKAKEYDKAFNLLNLAIQTGMQKESMASQRWMNPPWLQKSGGGKGTDWGGIVSSVVGGLGGVNWGGGGTTSGTTGVAGGAAAFQ